MRLNFRYLGGLMLAGCLMSSPVAAQTAQPGEVDELRQMVHELSARVAALEAAERHRREPSESAAASGEASSGVNGISSSTTMGSALPSPASAREPQPAAEAASVQPSTTAAAAPQQEKTAVVPAQLPGGATLNYFFDGYYGYDFNHPLGRVQYLRAYDVLSNAFSINQAGLVLALDPDVNEGRRYGVRLDLQFGQATDTLQGNAANEPRPEIYRNIFQAYGTYVFPLGKGLTVDVGKWSSAIGLEGNYTKDQMNYSRSYFFDYLPFYHAGVRASYKVNDKLAVNYWLVNGTQQSEPTNSYKDELFGFTLQPKSNLSWLVNYYVGQDHPDSVHATNCGTAPIQPGLCLTPVSPAPDGKQHIFDSYATWNVTPKVTLALEGDYVISRLWANATPGESSAPSHVAGGVGYARYQWTKHSAIAGRAEYLSDRNGLFSGTSQALKEFTGTYEYKVADGLLTRLEYRRDWSNNPFFLTNKVGVLASHQDTLTVGMVWWYGGKRGVW
jgi:outer membrane murein-binding lipoprotein Lpp